MKLLRAVLRWQAVLWAVMGLALLVAPGWLVERLLDQAPLEEDGWMRVAGVMAIALAGQMVLVGRRVEELWWWAWTFALLELGTAAALLLNAVFGPPNGSPAWPWWALGILNAGLAAVEISALAKAGTERSPV